MEYDYLYQYISVGIENAVHQKDLALKLHTTPAAAKNIVRRARQQGLEICSGAQGYWFAKDEEEKKAFVKSMQKQAFSRLKSASPMKNTLNSIKGQIELFDDARSASQEAK